MTDLVATNLVEWTERDGRGREVKRRIMPGDPIDATVPAEVVARGAMDRRAFLEMEATDRSNRLGGLLRRRAELDAEIARLTAEDAEIKGRQR